MKAGIAATDGHAFLKPASDMGYRTSNEEVGIPVKMISIPTLLASHPPSDYTPFLLKIDIEGMEENVLGAFFSAASRKSALIRRRTRG